MMALSWGLACGFGSSLPYFYALFFTCMIIHRQIRSVDIIHTSIYMYIHRYKTLNVLCDLNAYNLIFIHSIRTYMYVYKHVHTYICYCVSICSRLIFTLYIYTVHTHTGMRSVVRRSTATIGMSIRRRFPTCSSPAGSSTLTYCQGPWERRPRQLSSMIRNVGIYVYNIVYK